MLPTFSIQTVSFLISDVEAALASQLMKFISELYATKQKHNYLVEAVNWVHNIDFAEKVAQLYPKISPAGTSSREYFFFHHLWGKSKRYNILTWAAELNLSGFIAPGKPGFMCFEGDTNDLKVIQQRSKSMKWKEFKFLSQFASSPSSSFSSILSSPFEYLHPKWQAMEEQSTGLVQSVIDKHHFVEMLQSLSIPQSEIDLLLKYLPQ